MTIGLIASALSLFLVFIMGLLSYRDEFFSVKQMTERGISQGVPFLGHYGMWGDIFIITPLVGLIINSSSWSTWQIAISLFLGAIVSAFMHKTYAMSGIQEATTENGKLTDMGKVHAVYMALVLGVLSLFYIYTPAPPNWLLILSLWSLIIHIALSTHLIFSYTRPRWFPFNPVKNPATLLVVLIAWVFLVWRTFLLL